MDTKNTKLTKYSDEKTEGTTMIQAAIAGLILLGIYKLIAYKPKEEGEFHAEIDWWLALAFVFVPSILLFYGGLALAAMEAPTAIVLIGYSLYFIIPFLIMKFMLDYKNKEAIKLAAIVPFVAIATEIPFYFILAA